MSIEKCKDFEKDGYGTWDDSSKPTTFANMYDFMKNQNNVTLALVNSLWQPSTAYVVGAVIHSPSLPAGCKATCTTEGTTGSTEPKWTAYGTTMTDGTVKWAVETDVQGTITGEVQNAITSAINTLHDTIKTEMQTAITSAINTLHDTIKTEMQTAITTSAINTLHDTIKTEMQTAMLALFPVGTILETTNSANPSTYIGGTWEQLDAGLTTITAGTYKETHNGTEDTYVFTAGSSNFTRNGVSMAGEAEHVITEGELPHLEGRFPGSITPSFQEDCTGIVSGTSNPSFNKSCNGAGVNTWGFKLAFGSNQPHNNIAPLYGVYRFRRLT